MCAAVFLGMTAVARVAETAAMSCENLLGLTLSNAKITSAKTVAAGAFVQPGGGGGGAGGGANAFRTLPSFCRVEATLTPSSDSDIKIELWLPSAGWNGKF